MKNSKTFNEYVAPIMVLVCICFVITGALALTYGVAKPIIDRNTIKFADDARTELLPEADTFIEYDGELHVAEEGKVFVTECYIANNGSGMVVTVSTKSFGGVLTEMIGIDSTGAITGVKVTDHADTPGLGTKAHDAEHLAQYKGLGELQATDAKSDSSVQYITGATISSNAVHYGVHCALDQYKSMGGVR